MRGNDVIAHKRAVSRAFPKLYPWWKNGFSNFYGVGFEKAVADANKALTGRHKGVIDKTFHEAIEKRHAKNKPDQWAFDLYAEKLANDFCASYSKVDVREMIVDAAWFWYEHRYDIHYDQTRPFQKRKPPAVPTEWDCSAFAINTYYGGGAKDPSGRSYSGYGYTGDLWTNGKTISYSNIEIADLILYGFTTNSRPGFPYGSPTHVAVYVGRGMVLSLGSYPMRYLEYNYRSINCIKSYL
jgi:hypothetical protein